MLEVITLLWGRHRGRIDESEFVRAASVFQLLDLRQQIELDMALTQVILIVRLSLP